VITRTRCERCGAEVEYTCVELPEHSRRVHRPPDDERAATQASLEAEGDALSEEASP
jgi:hypothetical protein